MAAPLPRVPRLITFDCYGTLIDWDAALRQHLATVLASVGANVDAEAFHARWYRQHHLPALTGPYRPYRQLLRETLIEALAAEGLEAGRADVDALSAAMLAAEPFADAVPVLRQLRELAPLGTLSNSQRDLIAISVAKLGDPFAHVLTGEDTGAYKPSTALFERVLADAQAAARDVVHVAQSQDVDLPASVPLGIATVWVNRKGQVRRPEVPAPTAELPDLAGLPALLAASAGDGRQ